MAIEASRIAIKHMVPVIILSDGYLANGAEPWKVPKVEDLPEIPVHFETNPVGFLPYRRDPVTLSRPWAIPGTPGLEHRIGGIEKQDVTGNINYEPLNHEHMVRLRAAKVESVANDIPPIVVDGDQSGDLLIIAWGSTHGPITAALNAQREKGRSVGHVHLRHLNPLPRDLGAVIKRFKKVLVPEMNMGQFLMVLRAKYLVDAQGYDKIQGKPFKTSEIELKIEEMLGLAPSLPPEELTADQEGESKNDHGSIARLHKKRFSNRPGNSLVSGMRRLRDSFGGADGFRRPGNSARKICVCFRDRLLEPVSLLHEHVSDSTRFTDAPPPVATGLKIVRPDLEVWVATGDGDSLSIGGNHTIHMLRRNVGLKVLLFNNKIYGLTKGQYSPTSEVGKKTKSTPFGTTDRPFNPISLAIGSEATFVARSVDVFQQHLKETLKKAAAHKGSAYVEILQNCNIFNDGAWETVTEKDARSENIVMLEHGKPLIYGKNRDKGIRLNGLELEVVHLGNGSGFTEKDLLVHDENHPRAAYAFTLAHMEQRPGFPTPIGVLRSWGNIPRYEDLINDQIKEVQAKRGKGDLAKLLRSGDTWELKG